MKVINLKFTNQFRRREGIRRRLESNKIKGKKKGLKLQKKRGSDKKKL